MSGTAREESDLGTLLVTGGMGFIGSNFLLRMRRRYPSLRLVNLDALTYAGYPANIAELDGDPNVRFIHGDITDAKTVAAALREFGGVDAIVHFAAESHVDRSIADPGAFVRTNVIGTQVLLEEARRAGLKRFVHVSTDEVYGSLGDTGFFTETTPLSPNSPYSASKAGSDLLARAYFETFGLPVVTTRCSNNYGPRQFPEKLVPKTIFKALADEPIPVYGDGRNVRDWLYVDDHAAAVELALFTGKSGEVYNIGGHNERTNLEIVRRILDLLGKPHSLIRFVDDRLGHDRRYAIDPAKAERELGWKPVYDFDRGLRETIDWYLRNESWRRGLAQREEAGG